MAQNEATVELKNEVGLHARPASTFVQTTKKFEADVTVEKVGGDEGEVNAKSILKVLSLGAEHGDEITIRTEGEDGEEAMEKIVGLVENKFEEE